MNLDTEYKHHDLIEAIQRYYETHPKDLEGATEEEIDDFIAAEEKLEGVGEYRVDDYGIPENRVITGEWDGEPIHRKKTLQERHQTS